MTMNRMSLTGSELLDDMQKKGMGLIDRHTLFQVKDINDGIVHETRSDLHRFLCGLFLELDTKFYIQKTTFGRNGVDESIFHIIPFPKYWKSTTGFNLYAIVNTEIENGRAIFLYDSKNPID